MTALPQIPKCVVLPGSCEQQQYRSVRGMGILPNTVALAEKIDPQMAADFRRYNS
jgi:hypothetical protein